MGSAESEPERSQYHWRPCVARLMPWRAASFTHQGSELLRKKGNALALIREYVEWYGLLIRTAGLSPEEVAEEPVPEEAVPLSEELAAEPESVEDRPLTPIGRCPDIAPCPTIDKTPSITFSHRWRPLQSNVWHSHSICP